MCVRVFSVGFGPGLDSVPQGLGAPPAMLRGRTAGFPKKLGGRRGGVGGYNLHSVPPDCGTPTTSRLYPFGACPRSHPSLQHLNPLVEHKPRQYLQSAFQSPASHT